MRLAEAYARYLSLGGTPLPLVLAGGKGWLMDDFQKHLRTLAIDNRVIMTGYVSDDELIWLYRNCYANLYPSLFEGFGLPVLEGMQYGAPTLTSRTTSMPEVAGDAAVLLDTEDIDEWAQAKMQLINDLGTRSHLSFAACEHAALFDWRMSSTSILRLYDVAVSSPKQEKLI